MSKITGQIDYLALLGTYALECEDTGDAVIIHYHTDPLVIHMRLPLDGDSLYGGIFTSTL